LNVVEFLLSQLDFSNTTRTKEHNVFWLHPTC